ncbi:cytochrome b/b6 domain-containing protein [candidate division KSB1 bacterium]
MHKLLFTGKTRAILIRALFAVLLSCSAAFGQELSQETQNCFECHDAEALTYTNAAGRVIDVAVDPEKYRASDHARLNCIDCHSSNYTVHPHTAERTQFTCIDCHSGHPDIQFDDIETGFFESVHYERHSGWFSCFSCHNIHEFKADDGTMPIPAKVERGNAACLGCHDSPAVPKSHEWLPNRELHWGSVRCIECHTPVADHESHNIQGIGRAEKNCVACHAAESILLHKLYRHRVGEERRRSGFINSIVLNDAYIVGMTRNIYLDRVITAIFAMVLLVIILHAAGRLTTRKERPGPAVHVVHYQLWLRLWHWCSAALFILLIITGLSLHYSGPDSPLLSFSTARAIHNICGPLLTIMYLFFFVANIISGNWRQYIPSSKGLFGRLMKQAAYNLAGVFKGKPDSFRRSDKQKFNPLQQVTYLGIMYGFVLVIVISGNFLMLPELAPESILGFAGFTPMAVIHVAAGFLASIFLVGHIYFATTGTTPFSKFRDMFTGGKQPHKKISKK